MVEDAEEQLEEARRRLEEFDESEAMHIAAEVDQQEGEERRLEGRISLLKKQIEDLQQRIQLVDTVVLKILGEEGNRPSPSARGE